MSAPARVASALVVLLPCACALERPWPSTLNGVHYHITDIMDGRTGPNAPWPRAPPVFVWATSRGNDMVQWRHRAPGIVLSQYVPYSRDPHGSGGSGNRRNLEWWQEHHPEWILYQCDRVTPRGPPTTLPRAAAAVAAG